MWRTEQRAFYIGSSRAKPTFNITLAYEENEFSFSPNDLMIDIEDFAHIQTSTPTGRMHQKLTKHGKSVVCRTTNSQATKRMHYIDEI